MRKFSWYTIPVKLTDLSTVYQYAVDRFIPLDVDRHGFGSYIHVKAGTFVTQHDGGWQRYKPNRKGGHRHNHVRNATARWVKKATKSYIAIPYKKVTWKYGKSPSFNPVQTHDFVWEQKFPNKADIGFWKGIFDRIGENKVKAGSQHGERSTPFTRTIEALRKAAKEHPEYGLKDLLRITPTHYCHIDSAASAISSWASKGVIEKFWK